MTARRLGAVLAGLLLLAAGAGCTARAEPPAAAPAAGAPAAAAVSGVLSFTGRTIDGEPFDAATLAGRPALLWFWAPWCATCAAQAGSVTNIHEEYGDRLGILGVGAVRNLDDEAGVLWRRFGITEQSTYVLVDRAGTVVSSGYLDDLQLTTEVRSLVA